MTIADRIKNKRIELDMSQTELADRAKYSNKAAISKLEHAGDNISMKQVKRIATALGVSPAYLMGWEDENNGIIIERESRDTEQAIRLYQAYLKAIPEVQEAVERLLKSDLSDS